MRMQMLDIIAIQQPDRLLAGHGNGADLHQSGLRKSRSFQTLLPQAESVVIAVPEQRNENHRQVFH